MNRSTVNFSTGPVNPSREVQEAFNAPPVSHRSSAFQHLFIDTTDLLCNQFNCKFAFILSGSGTTANDAMIWQIKLLGSKGLILSNGEFGSRLIAQAKRASLSFLESNVGSDGNFNLQELEKTIDEHKITWLLFCHCETSTGVVNDLAGIAAMCAKYKCLCFVDCMSTVGTGQLDLSHISMATASSGKGLASLPGLAIILSNIKPVIAAPMPICLDLAYYESNDGIPFTISSNQLQALYTSIKQKLQATQFKLIDKYALACYEILRSNDLLPHRNKDAKVFTIMAPNGARDFRERLSQEHIQISYESGYLVSCDLCQLAFFGYYDEEALNLLVSALNKTVSYADKTRR